jgi:ATP-dependent exoDNAse (exonuclease V) beta subunit
LDLVELAEFPCGPFVDGKALEEARRAYVGLAQLLLTADGTFRKRVDINLGFPPGCKQEKLRILGLIAELEAIPGLASSLKQMHSLPPARYVDEDWQIVQACFTLLRQAAGHLRAVFAEAGAVDFTEIAQIAQQVLKDEDEFPSEIALAAADDIRHLLVDEFQDTSRRQYQLLCCLVSSWGDQAGRTVFLVGDPMQSIYSFRDADPELFARVRDRGLELRDNERIILDSLKLRANFRTDASLVHGLNHAFLHVFSGDDGSGVIFTPTEPARNSCIDSQSRLQLHLEFMPQIGRGRSSDLEALREKKEAARQCETAQATQVAEIVELIRSHSQRIENARVQGKK